MRITTEEAQAISWEESDKYEVHEEGEWIDGGKFQYQTIIFKDEAGKFYELSIGRSGSPFTDWTYDFEWNTEYDCPEVELVEVVIKVWKKKQTE